MVRQFVKAKNNLVAKIIPSQRTQAMNQTSASYPSFVDKIKEVGLIPVKSDIVRAPRVAKSPINMESQLRQILEFGKDPGGSSLNIGKWFWSIYGTN